MLSLLLCFNLSMLQCALAAGQAHACPGCPTQQQDGDHAHHGMDHGADSQGHECSVLDDGCCELQPLAPLQKTAKSELQGPDFAPDLWLNSEPWYLALHEPVPAAERCPTGPPPGLAGAPRLHVLNCTYLN